MGEVSDMGFGLLWGCGRGGRGAGEAAKLRVSIGLADQSRAKGASAGAATAPRKPVRSGRGGRKQSGISGEIVAQVNKE
ncbi:hypothetical protein NBRC116598_34710 [Pseudophaeobacter arcticus]|uniref:Uncharacterized protein n=1 Tax=Pseudophaeobacter arcticus TaxID=385492 RepID=A0ABQ0AQ85_9RHOB